MWAPRDAANAVIVVEKSVTTFNGVGLFVSANGWTVACAMLASDTSITRNSIFGIEQQGPSVATSYGGNTVFNNSGNTFGLTVPQDLGNERRRTATAVRRGRKEDPWI